MVCFTGITKPDTKFSPLHPVETSRARYVYCCAVPEVVSSVDCPPCVGVVVVVDVLNKCLATNTNTAAAAITNTLLIMNDIFYPFVIEISVVSETFHIPVIENTR